MSQNTLKILGPSDKVKENILHVCSLQQSISHSICVSPETGISTKSMSWDIPDMISHLVMLKPLRLFLHKVYFLYDVCKLDERNEVEWARCNQGQALTSRMGLKHVTLYLSIPSPYTLVANPLWLIAWSKAT